MNDLFGIVALKCPQCGRQFDRLSVDWTYKLTRDGKINYYCKYSCWVKAIEEASIKEAKSRAVRLKADQRVLLQKMLVNDEDIATIAKRLNVTEQAVFYYRRKLRKKGVLK